MNNYNLKSIRLVNYQCHEDLTLDFTDGINVITGLTSTGKCLTGDTIVPCPVTGKFRTIYDMLNDADWKVWSVNKQNKLVIGKVKNIQVNGIKPVYELYLQSGQKIKSTLNHKFFTNEGWKELKDITTEDYIATAYHNPEPQITSNLYSKEQCFVLGCLLADGSFTGHINFTNGDKNILKKFINNIHVAFGDHHCSRKNNNGCYTLTLTSPRRLKQRINRKMNVINNWIHSLGLFNLNSYTKYIPNAFFQLSNECISSLLSGLFLCDGYIPQTNRVIEYSTVSEKLAYQIQWLLLRFKIRSIIREKFSHYYKPDGTKSKNFKSYLLTISDKPSILRFYKNIPLIGIKKHKIKKLIILKQKTKNQSTNDVYPKNFTLLLYKLCQESKYTAKQLNTISGYKESKAYHIGGKKRKISQYRANKLAKVLNNTTLNKLFLNDVKWIKVTNISYIGNQPTFDLEVNHYHNFIANGIVTHNSAIFKALTWLYGYSNIAEVDYRKEGTDLTSVSVTLHSGFEVEKIRTKSINRYVLKKDGCNDKIFDNINKDVPEEIQSILGISVLTFDKLSLNVNFSEQDDLNFIFDSKIPGSFCAKLLNKLTGNELLDKLFQDCNKEKLNISGELKSLDSQLEKQKEDVENCTKEYEELNSKLQKVKEVYSKIEEKIIIYDELKRLASKLKDNKEAEDFVKFKLSKIITISDKVITELKEKSELLKELTLIQNRLKEVKLNLDLTKEEQNLIKIPKIDLDLLKQKAEMYSDLEIMYDTLNQNKESQEKIKLQIKEKQTLLGNLNKQLKEIWNKLSFCDSCKPKVEQLLFKDK